MPDLVAMTGIQKRFGGLAALKGVDFSLRAGEVHALLGENGAGKSTMMGVLSGKLAPDGGTIMFADKPVRFGSPRDAIDVGIEMIHQEMALAPDLSVAENIFLGSLPPMISWFALRRKARVLIERLGFAIDPAARVGDLTVAHQQVVEIAKALSRDAKVIIFDEPTAVLAARDAEQLLRIIRELSASGVGVVYISHRLDEVLRISDRMTVMKDGGFVGTVTPKDTGVNDLIRMMVGRPLSALYGTRIAHDLGAEVLRVEHLSAGLRVKDVSFTLRAGEILGLGGLVGSGRTEVARLIFGADKRDAGRILLNGKEAALRHPGQAVKAGIGLVPEDRKRQGVVLDMSIRVNTTMARMAPVTSGGFIRWAKERATVMKLAESLRLKMAGPEAPASSLSGGNQQKVVLAKWLHVDGPVMILDEPTRGVDVGAKAEIYTIIHRLAAEGRAVIVISSEHQELFALCDRVLVMGEGRLRGELTPDLYSEENLLSLAIGGKPAPSDKAQEATVH
ncbi:sugar ABC transporter ATP-binding protein [Lichenifustis flavocetrariae]|uniref:Sugar ABC transporter ATP-binding protein n=1 Tax=Lichenifustis flavocetrariae TaxID=2949735 RepID=A0AA42CIT8_9HYPH|nr:sugar ABC transporter ATP-binding protein [Lichenifustis flavocetrariae]MCW6508883.1 sugar ABC transporter ATP-binding protein [Lichenifustis flavocetrariae]